MPIRWAKSSAWLLVLGGAEVIRSRTMPWTAGRPAMSSGAISSAARSARYALSGLLHCRKARAVSTRKLARRRRSAASADQQHELPAHVTVLADAVRLRDLGEREGLRDREREAPGLDQLADLGERVDRAASVPAAERHPVLLRATEVGDRHDVLRAARELDELGQDAAPGDVERGVDALGCERRGPKGTARGPPCPGPPAGSMSSGRTPPRATASAASPPSGASARTRPARP